MKKKLIKPLPYLLQRDSNPMKEDARLLRNIFKPQI